ncbi:MAG: AMP-binding protein [Desulfobacterales bacterium]|nr:AMP-binding protein [Desulfobacterales bacterium]
MAEHTLEKPEIEGAQTPTNVAVHLKKFARTRPFARAVVSPAGYDNHGRIAYSHLTFQQLDKESDCLAHGLNEVGITRGTRTILMVKPGIDFFVLTFALFKVGAVPVMVDPGMGIKRMVMCLNESRATAFIGIPKAHILLMFYAKYFKSLRIRVTVGRRWFWSGYTMDQLKLTPWEPFPMADTRADETAAILFTTGSTGPAKGVVYTHGIFNAQVRLIKSIFDIKPGEIDLPTFPLFALFDPTLGMTAIIPDMDPTRPAKANPEKIIEAITNQAVTNMFASPALLNRVGKYGKAHGIKLPTLNRIVSAGAPVAPADIEQFLTMLGEEAEIFTPYGATESMPSLYIGSKEILSETRKKSEQGYGNCVGLPADDTDVRIIKTTDTPIEKWDDSLVLKTGEIGEIVVRGDQVTKEYFRRPKADKLAKIADNGTIWHRMGDLGWMDIKGRVWFCGRKNHRVITETGTLYAVPCEAIFNNHPFVYRSALVGIGKPGKQIPVICIEINKEDRGTNKDSLFQELSDLAKSNEMTKGISTFLAHRAFPVDIRHNSKIFREQLSIWASKKLKIPHG